MMTSGKVSFEKQPAYADVLLWDAMKRGDKNALEQIYRHEVDDMFQYGMSIQRDRDLVKDAIHEVFLDVWRYRASISSTTSVKLYLLKCLSNRIRKVVAGSGRVGKGCSIEEVPELHISDDEGDLNQFQEEAREKLNRALQKIPLRQREALQNIFFENRGYDHTSYIMGINVQSVYTLVWKAINALKKEVLLMVMLAGISLQ